MKKPILIICAIALIFGWPFVWSYLNSLIPPLWTNEGRSTVWWVFPANVANAFVWLGAGISGIVCCFIAMNDTENR